MHQPKSPALVLSSAARRRMAVAGVLLAGSVLSACIVVPSGRHYGGYSGYGGPQPGPANDDGDGVVLLAPPAPQIDVVIAAPGPGYFWVGGYWNWVGGRHLWVGGRWQAQRPGYYWTPHAWQRYGQGWRSRPGQWQRG